MAAVAIAEQDAMVLSALRSRDFRRLWIGQTASTIGDSLILVAIALYVTKRTGSATDVGVVLAAYSLPLVLLLLLGGVVADRLPRKRLMVVADLIRALDHGVLAVLIATGAVRIPMMVVIGVIFAIAQAFFQPAYTAIVPQTVEPADIQGAQALGGLSREIAEFVSPAVATALVLTVGGAAAFSLDAATFVFSAVMVSSLRVTSQGAGRATAMIADLRDGWTAVRERGWVLWTIAAFTLALPLGLAPFLVLGAGIGRDVYHSEAVFGLANAAWGVGTVTGVLVASRWRPHRPMFVAMAGAVPWGLAVALYAAGPPVGVAYLGMLVAGVCLGVMSVFWETALAERIPTGLLSRVSAWDWMGSLALLPVGYLAAGPVAHAFGSARVVEIGGVLAAGCSAFGLLPRSTRYLRRLDPAGLDPADLDAADLDAADLDAADLDAADLDAAEADGPATEIAAATAYGGQRGQF